MLFLLQSHKAAALSSSLEAGGSGKTPFPSFPLVRRDIAFIHLGGRSVLAG